MDQKKEFKRNLCFLYTYTIELWCEFRGLWYTRSWVWSESFWGGNYIQTCFIPKRHKVLGNHLFVLSCFLGISVNQKSEGRYMRNNMVYLNPHSWVFSLCSSSFSFPLVIQHITYKHAAYLFLSSSSTRLSRGVNCSVSNDKSSISMLLSKRTLRVRGKIWQFQNPPINIFIVQSPERY